MWQVFISHASEDKDEVARPLARALTMAGILVWYDEDVLEIGDSLSEVVDAGLGRSNFGVVIISRHFMAKPWPRRELRGLVAREIQGRKAILPVWHGVSWSDVVEFSPPLADVLAMRTDDGLDAIVGKIAQAVGRIPVPALSKMEQELLRMVARGTPTPYIGEVLGISNHSVEERTWRLREKIGVGAHLQLVTYAVRTGLVDISEVGSDKRAQSSRWQ